MRGGKRINAGRKAKEEKTLTISFRVFSCAEPQIKDMLKKLSVKERTDLLLWFAQITDNVL
jgi:hypothetical protein